MQDHEPLRQLRQRGRLRILVVRTLTHQCPNLGRVQRVIRPTNRGHSHNHLHPHIISLSDPHETLACVSKPRRDRLYEKPRTTRHAWILDSDEPGAQPRQVYIVEWRRKSYKWRARVIYAIEVKGSDETATVDRWVPAETLRPVPADPNRAYGLR